MEHDELFVHIPGTSQGLVIRYPARDLPPRAQQEILTRAVEAMGQAMRATMGRGAQREPETPARPAPVPLRPTDEPCTDVRLFDTLMPLLEELAGLTSALVIVSPGALPVGQLEAVLRALAAQAEVAPTILQRWWNDRQDD